MNTRGQFTLRTLAFGVALIAAALVFRNQLIGLAYRWTLATTCLAFVASFLASRSLPLPKSRYWLALSVFLLIATLFACFTVIRLDVALSGSDQFPRNLPYPDVIISELEKWFRTPLENLPPNSIDMHGGLTETLAIINGTAIITAVLAGLAIGSFIIGKRRITTH